MITLKKELITSQIKRMNNRVISLKTLLEIEAHPDVSKVESCGFSAQYPGVIWYDIQFLDGSDIDVFIDEV
jgi:hypothetical protein